MPSAQAAFISIGLARLRRGVTACCVIAALALIVQLMVWAMATFMDVRYATVEDKPTSGSLVVKADGAKAAASANEARRPERARENDAEAPPAPPVDPNRVPS